MENTVLYSKLASLPEKMKDEVSDFIDFLLTKAKSARPGENKKSAKFGSAKGMFTMMPDFDEPLEEFKDYM